MRQVEVFADVLERELQRDTYTPDAYTPEPGGDPMPTNPFLCVDYPVAAVAAQILRPVGDVMAQTTRPRAAASEAAPWSGWLQSQPISEPAAAAPPPPDHRRSGRILMARERRALRELIALGADLHADFSAHELRHAFRILAKRYHPDSCPDGSEAAKALLSRTFGVLAENHRCLLAVVESVGPIRH
jgi:hypothetical protein